MLSDLYVLEQENFVCYVLIYKNYKTVVYDNNYFRKQRRMFDGNKKYNNVKEKLLLI